MADKALPIGSVIKAKNAKLIIVGYKVFHEEEKIYTGYFVVRYPRGYAGVESIGILLLDEVEEVLFEGYRTDAEKRFTESLEEFSEKANGIKASELEKYFEALNEQIDKNRKE